MKNKFLLILTSILIVSLCFSLVSAATTSTSPAATPSTTSTGGTPSTSGPAGTMPGVCLAYDLGGGCAVKPVEPDQQSKDFYNNLIRNGNPDKKSSPLTAEQTIVLIESKKDDKDFDKFMANMNSEDFQKTFSTEKGLKLLNEKDNPKVWAKLESEMSNKGNWMNKEDNRPILEAFIKEKGLGLPDNFKKGMQTPNGAYGTIELLNYDSKTGQAELRQTTSILGTGPVTKINLNEIKAFCGSRTDCVKMDENVNVEINGAKLGAGTFKLAAADSKVAGSKAKINVEYEKGFWNTEKSMDLTNFKDTETIIEINHAGGKGVVNLPEGASFKDTSYSMEYMGGSLKATATGKDISTFNSKGVQTAVFSTGSATYFSPSSSSNGYIPGYRFENAETVTLYDYGTGFFGGSNKYGTVNYVGAWQLADSLENNKIDDRNIPIVAFKERSSGWWDIGNNNARTMTVYNGANTDFNIKDLARDSWAYADYGVFKDRFAIDSAPGRVIFTTEDGAEIITRSKEIEAKGDSEGQIALDFANRDPKVIGTIRGRFGTAGTDGVSREVRFDDRWNVPFGVREDQVVIGVVEKDSNGKEVFKPTYIQNVREIPDTPFASSLKVEVLSPSGKSKSASLRDVGSGLALSDKEPVYPLLKQYSYAGVKASDYKTAEDFAFAVTEKDVSSLNPTYIAYLKANWNQWNEIQTNGLKMPTQVTVNANAAVSDLFTRLVSTPIVAKNPANPTVAETKAIEFQNLQKIIADSYIEEANKNSNLYFQTKASTNINGASTNAAGTNGVPTTNSLLSTKVSSTNDPALNRQIISAQTNALAALTNGNDLAKAQLIDPEAKAVAEAQAELAAFKKQAEALGALVDQLCTFNQGIMQGTNCIAK
jgi:hypothetical protein